ncbi:MAG: hypothetical protein SWN10_10295 [Pseudomonadota bacterium]|nr:hypothetical protein [Pseudomonadota bacterium]
MEQENANQSGNDNPQVSVTADVFEQAKFRLLNKFAVIAFTCFALGHFLPLVDLSDLGLMESMSAADSMSGGQMVLLLFCLLIGIGTAATGIFPLAAKAIALFFLINYGLQAADLFDEASDIATSLDFLGIDLSKGRGWSELIKVIGIGAYFLIAGYLLMLVSLFLKSKSRDEKFSVAATSHGATKERAEALISQSSNGVTKYLNILNLQIAEIKSALREHDANNSVNSMKSGVEKVKTATDNKQASSGVDGVYEVVKNLFGYVFGYTTTVFKTNVTGKVIVVIGLFLGYQLIF